MRIHSTGWLDTHPVMPERSGPSVGSMLLQVATFAVVGAALGFAVAHLVLEPLLGVTCE